MRTPLCFASRTVVAAISCVLFATPVTAQQGTPSDAVISPDGTTVAWAIRGKLHLSKLADQDADVLVVSKGGDRCSNEAPVWSPDGQWLAYTSTCASKDDNPSHGQIFLWSKATGESKQLTHVTGLLDQAAWSPDGKTLAFLFVENGTRTPGGTDAIKPRSGVIGEGGVEIQRVAAVDVASGRMTQDTFDPKLHVYEFAWAPDSKRLAYIAAPAPGENNWWIAKVYTETFPLTTVCRGMCGPLAIFDPNETTTAMKGLQIAVPRWSPDGKRIAFIGGLMSDQGITGGDVWTVDAKGGAPVDVTPGIDGTPLYEGWMNDHAVGFVEQRRGHTWLSDYDVNTRAVVPGSSIDLGEVSVGGGAVDNAVSYTAAGVFAFVKSGLTEPPEVWAGPLNKLEQVTHLNGNAQRGTKVESIEWENEGFHVQGWLTFPRDYDPAKKYPMIVSVHGGPSAVTDASWGDSMWAENGYFEFEPNPRGSFGQGEAFVQANRKDFGYGDLRDILKGMDAVEAKFPIDKNREGLTGWSYGGFMTMFAVTQTHRFRAAVAGAGISDWLSYYGENSIDQWMIPFFGSSVYDDPAVYAKSSAITFVKNAKTPMLIIVGERDGECPPPQSFEMWHALRDLGVKTQLVVYPDEGHGFRDPGHVRDRDEREVRWFAENMAEEQ